MTGLLPKKQNQKTMENKIQKITHGSCNGLQITRISNDGELSLYSGDLLTKNGSAAIAGKIAVAFGGEKGMSQQKIALLLEMMIDEGFTVDRANDTVKHVIKSHIAWGCEPPIGAFISYDKKVKLFHHNEIGGFRQPDWKEVNMVRIEGVSACWSAKGQVFYARKSDIARYGMTVATPKELGQDWVD